MRTLVSPIPREAPKLLHTLALVAALVVILVMSSSGWADSCSTVSLSLHGMPIACTIPEQNPELAVTIGITGLSFTAQAQGMVLLYDDSAHTILSDVVTFTNVGGVATVTFLSDSDVLLTPPGLPILGKFSEGKGPIFISLALGNGDFLHARICSDTENPNCPGGNSDSISLKESTSSIPEPGTFLLLGSGLFGSGALKLSAGSLRRRLLKAAQS